MQKTNQDYPLVLNAEIVEWDIKSANISLMSYYNLLPKEKIDPLRNLPKQEREIAVGKLMRKDKDFSKSLEKSFNLIIKEFMTANNLTMDDIISIKKDAVFVKNRQVKVNQFGEHIEFRPKNTYQHFILLPKYEFYIGKETIDVKGIVDNVLPLHKDGIISLMRLYARYGNNYLKRAQFLHELCAAYKSKELELCVYREFTSQSIYRVITDGYVMELDDIEESDIPNLLIDFNYREIILPLLKLSI